MDGPAASQSCLLPGLAGFYAAVSDLWYPMIRVTAGGCLLYHSWGKLDERRDADHGRDGEERHFRRLVRRPISSSSWRPLAPSRLSSAWFTRFFAAGIAIEMAVIAFHVQMPQGLPHMELFLLWGIVMFAIALHGGGPYSLDRKIGKEL